MLHNLVKKIFGSRNDRLIRNFSKVVKTINQLDINASALSNEQLANKTQVFRERFKKGETLDQLLPEAFAVVREASFRTLRQRPYDTQLLGGMALHQGSIAEMRTGEGKTLSAALPAYLNALTGESVHIITVNDYLAERDASALSKLYNFLGLQVGIIKAGLSQAEKKAAYSCDIVYGTNNEFGFDYLRDNMAFSKDEQVQGTLNFAIVDEVDSILIDEARTPLIISGAADDSSELYLSLTSIVPLMTARLTEEGPGDYYLDEKTKQAHLTDEGHQRLEEVLAERELIQPGDSLYSAANILLMHYFSAVLRANTLYKKDVDYIVADQQIVIIDEHTGRAMQGRRWSDGLHQAIEAKEGVPIHQENQTLASITFQNFFKLYKKLAGMTGTADTEAYEFHQIYNLEVVVIPTHRPMIRKDYPDIIFLTATEKFKAIVEEIKVCHAKGQPVLVGTASIETSELLSSMLKAVQIPHEVLNAKQHEREAKIIAQAGAPGAVTIATNMAGRGTDIILGGSAEAEIAELENPSKADIEAVRQAWKMRHDAVIAAQGLHILGTERHESRRIDNQLRGRSGRQGDPGSSRFYLSLDDALVRIFASARISALMRKLGMGEGEAIESKMISRAIENAQRKVENYHFDVRKQLLEYDNVINDQRHVIYRERQDILNAENVADIIENLFNDVSLELSLRYIALGAPEESFDLAGLIERLHKDFVIDCPLQEWLDSDLDAEEISKRIQSSITTAYHDKRKADPSVFQHLEKTILLQTLDTYWREHLFCMDHLRHSISLRGYAQKDPKQEYKREAFELFSHMLDGFRSTVVSNLSKVRVVRQEEVAQMEDQWRNTRGKLEFQHQEVQSIAAQAPIEDINSETVLNPTPEAAPPRSGPKIGRNDLCFCGSQKKYKHCHGQLVT